MRYDGPDDRFYLQCFWRNLENNVIVTSASLVGGNVLVAPSDPMTYGGQGGVRFRRCPRHGGPPT